MNSNYYHEYKDMYNYYKIITKINPNYKLCFDKKNKDFVVINSAKSDEICLRFSNFNKNIEKELITSQSKNARQIFEMIETHNREIEETRKKDSANMLKTRVEELFHYSKRTNHISDSDIKKIIEVKNA